MTYNFKEISNNRQKNIAPYLNYKNRKQNRSIIMATFMFYEVYDEK